MTTHGFIEETVKFGKNESDVTSTAIRLSRAYTGRDLVAVCADHPCALVYATLDAGNRSPQSTMALFLQETIKEGNLRHHSS